MSCTNFNPEVPYTSYMKSVGRADFMTITPNEELDDETLVLSLRELQFFRDLTIGSRPAIDYVKPKYRKVMWRESREEEAMYDELIAYRKRGADEREWAARQINGRCSTVVGSSVDTQPIEEEESSGKVAASQLLGPVPARLGTDPGYTSRQTQSRARHSVVGGQGPKRSGQDLGGGVVGGSDSEAANLSRLDSLGGRSHAVTGQTDRGTPIMNSSEIESSDRSQSSSVNEELLRRELPSQPAKIGVPYTLIRITLHRTVMKNHANITDFNAWHGNTPPDIEFYDHLQTGITSDYVYASAIIRPTNSQSDWGGRGLNNLKSVMSTGIYASGDFPGPTQPWVQTLFTPIGYAQMGARVHPGDATTQDFTEEGGCGNPSETVDFVPVHSCNTYYVSIYSRYRTTPMSPHTGPTGSWDEIAGYYTNVMNKPWGRKKPTPRGNLTLDLGPHAADYPGPPMIMPLRGERNYDIPWCPQDREMSWVQSKFKFRDNPAELCSQHFMEPAPRIEGLLMTSRKGNQAVEKPYVTLNLCNEDTYFMSCCLPGSLSPEVSTLMGCTRGELGESRCLSILPNAVRSPGTSKNGVTRESRYGVPAILIIALYALSCFGYYVPTYSRITAVHPYGSQTEDSLVEFLSLGGEASYRSTQSIGAMPEAKTKPCIMFKSHAPFVFTMNYYELASDSGSYPHSSSSEYNAERTEWSQDPHQVHRQSQQTSNRAQWVGQEDQSEARIHPVEENSVAVGMSDSSNYLDLKIQEGMESGYDTDSLQWVKNYERTQKLKKEQLSRVMFIESPETPRGDTYGAIVTNTQNYVNTEKAIKSNSECYARCFGDEPGQYLAKTGQFTENCSGTMAGINDGRNLDKSLIMFVKTGTNIKRNSPNREGGYGNSFDHLWQNCMVLEKPRSTLNYQERSDEGKISRKNAIRDKIARRRRRSKRKETFQAKLIESVILCPVREFSTSYKWRNSKQEIEKLCKAAQSAKTGENGPRKLPLKPKNYEHHKTHVFYAGKDKKQRNRGRGSKGAANTPPLQSKSGKVSKSTPGQTRQAYGQTTREESPIMRKAAGGNREDPIGTRLRQEVAYRKEEATRFATDERVIERVDDREISRRINKHERDWGYDLATYEPRYHREDIYKVCDDLAESLVTVPQDLGHVDEMVEAEVATNHQGEAKVGAAGLPPQQGVWSPTQGVRHMYERFTAPHGATSSSLVNDHKFLYVYDVLNPNPLTAIGKGNAAVWHHNHKQILMNLGRDTQDPDQVFHFTIATQAQLDLMVEDVRAFTAAQQAELAQCKTEYYAPGPSTNLRRKGDRPLLAIGVGSVDFGVTRQATWEGYEDLFGVRFPGREFMNFEKRQDTHIPLLGADFKTWNERQLYVKGPKEKEQLRKKELCLNSILTASEHVLEEVSTTMYNYNASPYARYLYLSVAGSLVYSIDLFALGKAQFEQNRSVTVLPTDYCWTPAVTFAKGCQSNPVLRAMGNHASMTLSQNLVDLLQEHQVVSYGSFGAGYAAEALFNTCGLILREKELNDTTPVLGMARRTVPVVDIYYALRDDRKSIANLMHRVVCRPTQETEQDYVSSVFGYGGMPRKTKVFTALAVLMGRLDGNYPVRREDAVAAFADYARAPTLKPLIQEYVSANADYTACVRDLQVLRMRPAPEVEGSIPGIRLRAEDLREQILVMEHQIVEAVLGTFPDQLNFQSPLYELYVNAPMQVTYEYYGYHKGTDVLRPIYAKTCLLWDLLEKKKELLETQYGDPTQHATTRTPEARFEVRRFMTATQVIQLENGVNDLDEAHSEAAFRQAVNTSLLLPLLVVYASGGLLGDPSCPSVVSVLRSAKALVDKPYVMICEGPKDWADAVPDIASTMKRLIAETFDRIKRSLMVDLNSKSEEGQRETLRTFRVFEYNDPLRLMGAQFFSHLRGHRHIRPSDLARAMRQLYREFFDYYVIRMINFPIVQFSEGFEPRYELTDVSGPQRTEDRYIPYWQSLPPADGTYPRCKAVPNGEIRAAFEKWRESFREKWEQNGVSDQDVWDFASVRVNTADTPIMPAEPSATAEEVATAGDVATAATTSPQSVSLMTTAEVTYDEVETSITVTSGTQTAPPTIMDHDEVQTSEREEATHFRQERTNQLQAATSMGILRYIRDQEATANYRHDFFRRSAGFKRRVAMGKAPEIKPTTAQESEAFDLQRAENSRAQYTQAMLGIPTGGIFPFQTASYDGLPFRKYMHVSYGPAPATQKFEGDYWLKIMHENPSFYLSHESTLLNKVVAEELCVQQALLADGIRGAPCPTEGSVQQLRYVDILAENPVYQFFRRLRKESEAFDDIEVYETSGYATWRTIQSRFYPAGLQSIQCPVLKYHESSMICEGPHLTVEEVSLADIMNVPTAKPSQDTPMIGSSPELAERRKGALKRALKRWGEGAMQHPYPWMMPPHVYYATKENPGPKDYCLSRATIGGNESSDPDVSQQESDENMDE